MPKETVEGRWFGKPPKDATTGALLPADNSVVSVAWGRNRDATIGVIKDNEVTGAQCWVDLDRDGINRLIRSLRKARDQAYGQDA